MTRFLNPVEKNGGRITKQLLEQTEELNWKGVSFPTCLDGGSISNFERNNNIGVFVVGLQGGKFVPLRAPGGSYEKIVDLFFHRNEEGKCHYSCVRSLSRLLKSSRIKSGHKLYYCRYCLASFYKEDDKLNHTLLCSQHKCTAVKIPKEGSTLKFTRHRSTIRAPLVAYADFETMHKGVSEVKGKTHLVSEHILICFSVVFVSDIPTFRPKSVTYTGLDAGKKFVELLENVRDAFYAKFSEPVRMVFGEKEQEDHDSQTICYLCEEKFDDDHPKGVKVRDHNHFTAEYRGALHSVCNKQLFKSWDIPVFFHNLSSFDSHLFVQELGGGDTDRKAIPQNEEKYISFSKERYITITGKNDKKFVRRISLQFIDSLRHMQSSLSELVGNLPKERFRKMREKFGPDQVDLLPRKGIYPYEYADSFEKLEEKGLPPIEEFGSRLGCGIVYRESEDELGEVKPDHISEQDYAHAKNVYEKTRCTSLGGYTRLYCFTDAALLADVFEAYRELCMETYGLDPAHYVSSPSLAMDAMLKVTGVEIDLLCDQDMILFFEGGIRGGISVISKRYSKVNNKYMGDQYDPRKESNYIVYVDMNALYSDAMRDPLPVRNFAWIDRDKLDEMEKDHSLIKSCTLEVDLKVPHTKEFHDFTNCYPLAPEKKKINGIMKLTPNLLDKKRYIVHHKVLKLYLERGLVLEKIHRGVSYDEKTFMRGYIELNTQMRKNAKNKFEISFFKLMNNAVFGKQLESVRERSGIQIVNASSVRGEKRLKKLICDPAYKGSKIFTCSEIVSVNMAKKTVELTKPVMVGQTILDGSKYKMFNYWYNHAKPLWGDNVKLCLTDTDSFVMEVKTEDVYKDIAPYALEMYDTSNYSELFPNGHPSGLPVGLNKKVPGLMKDEKGGEIIQSFVGLRSKLYGLKTLSGNEEKKAKGVPKKVIKKSVNYDHYENCLFTGEKVMTQFYNLRPREHTIYEERVTKICLSSNDEKRYLLFDGSHETLAHGHMDIPKEHQMLV